MSFAHTISPPPYFYYNKSFASEQEHPATNKSHDDGHIDNIHVIHFTKFENFKSFAKSFFSKYSGELLAREMVRSNLSDPRGITIAADHAPESVRWRYYSTAAKVCLLQNLPTNAMWYLNKVSSDCLHPKYVYLKAYALEKLEDLIQAYQLYDSLLQSSSTPNSLKVFAMIALPRVYDLLKSKEQLSLTEIKFLTKYSTAEELFLHRAEKGDASAQSNLGFCYEHGEGVEKDLKEAVRLYKLAADQGDAHAQFNLGLCFDHGEGVEKDLKEAARLFKLAADQGDADAQYSLGVCFENGEGVEKDLKEAARLFKLAADQGDADAQFNLGVFYSNGEGVKKDLKEAARLFKLAADQGCARAQVNLGFCYANGEGVEKDLKEAARLYKLAADQGDVDARDKLDSVNKKLKKLQESMTMNLGTRWI